MRRAPGLVPHFLFSPHDPFFTWHWNEKLFSDHRFDVHLEHLGAPDTLAGAAPRGGPVLHFFDSQCDRAARVEGPGRISAPTFLPEVMVSLSCAGIRVPPEQYHLFLCARAHHRIERGLYPLHGSGHRGRARTLADLGASSAHHAYLAACRRRGNGPDRAA